MKSFTFNGIRKPWLYALQGRYKPPFPTINRGLTYVPGMPGAHLTTTDQDVLVINQPIGFVFENDTHALNLKDELASWLFTNEPAPLIFDDEPNRTYYAVVQNTIEDFERSSSLRSGTIQFLCVDPYGYSHTYTQPVSGRVSTILNSGTADTYPIFDLTVTKDSTLVYIDNYDNLTPQGDPRSIILGQTKPIDYEPVESKTLVLHDAMRSTAGWQGASEVDSGHVTGQFGVDPNGFYVETWGDENDENPDFRWIGPSLQRALPKALKSFQADIYIENRNQGPNVSNRAVGIIEVYMRDINGNLVCKMGFGDSFDNAAENQGTFVTSGQRYPAIPDQPWGWNNFDGILRIVRDSGYYYPYIARVTNGVHSARRAMGTIIPTPGVAENQVATIQVAMRKWAGAARMYQRIKEIKVYDMVGEFEFPNRSVPVNFKVGDKIRIDVGKGLVLLNGEPRTDLFALDTDFFSLVRGRNVLEFSDNVEGKIDYRERFL